MWAAFTSLSLGMKAAFIGGFLALLLVIGGSLYYVGYNKGNNNSKIAISKYEAKVTALQGALDNAVAKVDIRYVTEYKDRVLTNTVTVVKNHDVIITKVPEQFKFSNGWVYAYNQSINNLPIDPALASDDTASWVSDRQGLEYINTNNGIAKLNAEQLDSLIALTKARQEAVNEANK